MTQSKYNLTTDDVLKILKKYPNNNEELAKKYLALYVIQGNIDSRNYAQANIIKNHPEDLIELYHYCEGSMQTITGSNFLSETKETLELILDGYDLTNLTSENNWKTEINDQINLVFANYSIN